MRKRKRELTQKRQRRDVLARTIAKKVAEREEIEKRIASKQEREPVEERREKIDADLERLRRQYRDVRKRIGELRERRKKLARQIDRLVRWIRSHTVPKIVDLKLDFRTLSARPASNESVGHHTAGPLDNDGDAEAAALWRQYHQHHLNLGWAGLGYHVGIARSGTIFKLRPRYAYGAHTVGGNAYTGIVCHGTTGDKPTRAQYRALRYILKNPGKFGIPGGSLSGRLWLHRERNATACPGTHDLLYKSRGRA